MSQGTKRRGRQLTPHPQPGAATVQLSEDDISRDLLLAGQDPNDPAQRALYRQALSATQPRNPAALPQTLTGRIRYATGLSHTQIGDAIGASRSLMQAYDVGRAREMYSREDIEALRVLVAGRLAIVQQTLDELDKALRIGIS